MEIFSLVEDNVILIDGRISIREDEPVKIVASKITEFDENIEESATKQVITHNSIKTLIIDITDLDEDRKNRLRGAIKYFSGERANIKLAVRENGNIKPCGALLMNDKILDIFKEISGESNIEIS